MGVVTLYEFMNVGLLLLLHQISESRVFFFFSNKKEQENNIGLDVKLSICGHEVIRKDRR